MIRWCIFFTPVGRQNLTIIRLDEMAQVVAAELAKEIDEDDLAEMLAAMEAEEGDG